jgi:hypothetical protein
MFDKSLLSRAVESGIISAEQRDKLIAFAVSEDSGLAMDEGASAVRDEAPRFFRSFNDLFIGLGVAILGFALKYGAELVASGSQQVEFFALLGCAALFWLLAEWITGIRRINFPSIVILLFFIYFLGDGLRIGWEYYLLDGRIIQNTADTLQARGVVLISFALTAAMALYFWRFRLPFSVLMLAATIALSLLALLLYGFGPDALMPFMRWIVLALGLAIFAAAMYFDTQDPERSHRTSDHGFWLHLLAAPIITHSILWSSLQPLISNQADATSNANLMVIVVLGLFVVFSIVALVIDRRALLISSLGYAATALGYIIYKFDVEGNVALVITMLLIASLILTLGTGWYRLRRGVFALLPPSDFYQKLPPVTQKV